MSSVSAASIRHGEIACLEPESKELKKLHGELMAEAIEMRYVGLMWSYSWGESLLCFTINELAEIYSSEWICQLSYNTGTLNKYSLKSPF